MLSVNQNVPQIAFNDIESKAYESQVIWVGSEIKQGNAVIAFLRNGGE